MLASLEFPLGGRVLLVTGSPGRSESCGFCDVDFYMMAASDFDYASHARFLKVRSRCIR